MRKLLLGFFILLTVPAVIFAADHLYLRGRVLSEMSKMNLPNSIVIIYDDKGLPKDTIRANQGITIKNGEIDTLSYFSFNVPRVDSTYVFDVVCEGFATKTVTFTVEKIGKREISREIPIIYLSRPVQLREVTVTASKVKFYNKGDTVVYDASAFQLPEGSMLDALIAQLPGVELSADGQIKVNGEYVESLLLDGKKFFDNDNNIMLENIAAYTVKNIQVYEGVSQEDKLLGKNYNKVLTMDVKLKKEYNIGWLLNAQGGYGTENRYLGRLFAAWFNSKWRVSVIGNINNLNDNRSPGRNDTWTPQQMPSGRKRSAIGAVEYNYENNVTDDRASGRFYFSQSNNDLATRTDRTNFLAGGNTFDKSFGNNNIRSTQANTYNWLSFKVSKALRLSGSLSAYYSETKNSLNSLSGTFSENQDSISYNTLDAIYSLDKTDLLETVINRSKTKSDGWTKNYSINAIPTLSITFPNSGFQMNVAPYINYSSDKNELWKDYEINYGSNVFNSEKLRQYFDNTPNHVASAGIYLSYSQTSSNGYYYSLQYNYDFSETVKDSYMYALDRLADMGIYGTLPSAYLTAFDPQNSYKSRLIQNSHSLNGDIVWYKNVDNRQSFRLQLSPYLKLTHRHFNYWRNERDYHLSKTNLMLSLSGWWAAEFRFRFRRRGGDGPEGLFTNTLTYNYQIIPTLPDMFDMVDVVNDSDPLNIYLGNPDLKVQWYQRHRLRWDVVAYPHSFNNTFYVGYWNTSNSLTRGYIYDTSTGVRYNKMYNVNGNTSFQLTNEFKWQFGKSKQFTMDSFSEIELSHYSDMIGIDLHEPVKTNVNNRRITQNFKLSWKVGKANLGLRCDISNRYTTSGEEGFSTLNATHVVSGATAQVNLPAGFSLNTDLMCYTRNGYGTELLDTTDPVWNIRLAYCPPRNTRWVIMADGYDMLHTLNNVSYAVTASGRTVSYTNVLPRYFLLSVQYRLSLQPKKK